MNANDCRKKANEFLRAADFITDDLDARVGWLLLCNVWFSLADQIEEQAAESAAEAQTASEKPLAARPRRPAEAAERRKAAAVQLADLLRERLAL